MADSWYGLLTTDTTTREDELIEQTVAELIAGDLSSQLIFNKDELYQDSITTLTKHNLQVYRFWAY